jgi:hypothetical protein
VACQEEQQKERKRRMDLPHFVIDGSDDEAIEDSKTLKEVESVYMNCLQGLQLPNIEDSDESTETDPPSTSVKLLMEDQFFKGKTYKYEKGGEDSGDEIQELSKNLLSATKFVKRTHKMREKNRNRDMEESENKYHFECMKDVKSQELVTACLEKTVAAVSGDAVLQLPESSFYRWTDEHYKRMTDKQSGLAP